MFFKIEMWKIQHYSFLLLRLRIKKIMQPVTIALNIVLNDEKAEKKLSKFILSVKCHLNIFYYCIDTIQTI